MINMINSKNLFGEWKELSNSKPRNEWQKIPADAKETLRKFKELSK